jgi:beta-phosphoglucomutase
MIDAVIFDMDGTLVFNMRFHAEAWLETAREAGVQGATLELFENELAGLKNEELIPRVLGRDVAPDELDRIAQAKENRYRASYQRHMTPAPGVLRLLERLEGAGVRRAVATAAPSINRELVLDGLRLRDRFGAVVGAEQVTRGKPAPDLFLAAMAALGVAPARCVVFEDAPNGVRAAVAAGAACVGVTSVTGANELLGAGALATIDAFDPLPPAVEQLLFH